MSEQNIRTWHVDGKGKVQIHVTEMGASDATRTAVIVHGYDDHGGRYLGVGDAFVKRGYRVLIPDMRGHGRSGGQRGFVKHFTDYVEDLELVLARSAALPGQTVLIGHSNGGLIVSTLLATGSKSAAAAVLTSPLMGISAKPPAWKKIAGEVLGRIAPFVSLPTEIKDVDLTHDTEVLSRHAVDPLLHRVVNARWYVEAVAAMESAFANAQRIRVPILVLQAGDDRLVDGAAVARWSRTVPRCEFEVIPGAFHEVMFETEGAQHVERMLNWLDAQFAAARQP